MNRRLRVQYHRRSLTGFCRSARLCSRRPLSTSMQIGKTRLRRSVTRASRSGRLHHDRVTGVYCKSHADASVCLRLPRVARAGQTGRSHRRGGLHALTGCTGSRAKSSSSMPMGPWSASTHRFSADSSSVAPGSTRRRSRGSTTRCERLERRRVDRLATGLGQAARKGSTILTVSIT